MDKGIRQAIFHLHYYKYLTSKFLKNYPSRHLPIVKSHRGVFSPEQG